MAKPSLAKSKSAPDPEFVHAPPSVSERAFALRVRGDSMVNPAGGIMSSPPIMSFPPDSIIVVDPNVKGVPGYPVVVKLPTDGEATLRMYEFDGQDYFLRPLNPRYKTELMPANARIIGAVTSVQIETVTDAGRRVREQRSGARA